MHAATRDLGVHVDGQVDNAGFGAYGALVDADARNDQDMVMVDVAAPVALTHRFLPAMVTRRDGIVVRAENQHTGVRVVACAPTATDTECFQVGGNDREARFGAERPPSGVVTATLDALDRGAVHTLVGLRWELMALLPRLPSRAAMARTTERMTRPQN